MNIAIGSYYYCPRYHAWAVYQKETNFSDKLIEWCGSKEEARKKVYQLNGWNVPK